MTEFDDDVGFWQSNSGRIFESTKIGEFMESVIGTAVSMERSRDTYKMLQETIANSVEHAYINKKGEKLATKVYHKYWAFAGVRNNRAIVLVLDLGVGIPLSIRATHSDGILQKAMKGLKIDRLRSDKDYIRVATVIRKTRKDMKKGRGHGLSSIIESAILKDSHLSIYSNKGRYSITGSNKQAARVRHSINGTMIELSFDLDEPVSL